jgi:hypothetical protein
MKQFLVVLTNDVSVKTKMMKFSTDASARRFAHATEMNPNRFGRVVRINRDGAQVFPLISDI